MLDESSRNPAPRVKVMMVASEEGGAKGAGVAAAEAEAEVEEVAGPEQPVSDSSLFPLIPLCSVQQENVFL